LAAASGSVFGGWGWGWVGMGDGVGLGLGWGWVVGLSCGVGVQGVGCVVGLLKWVAGLGEGCKQPVEQFGFEDDTSNDSGNDSSGVHVSHSSSIQRAPLGSILEIHSFKNLIALPMDTPSGRQRTKKSTAELTDAIRSLGRLLPGGVR